jgi:tRNA-specific 2-thiouridylase
MTALPKVAVAMSGGVDSSVAAALLREQGFDVIGMMLRLWSEPGKENSNRCCTPEAMSLARRAAASLDIPFYVIDAKDAFQDIVVRSFLDGYAAGETPNPCLQCNRKIRWTLLLEHALALGAEGMATGHYARIARDADGKVRLFRARDKSKDQSYVLHVLTQSQLTRALFPLGEHTKAEVRALARRFGLPSAARQDSQDLCFLAGGDYRDFVRRRRPEMLVPGEIVDSSGKPLGRHAGLANYTIGQRKGLNVGSAMPLYVIRKETGANRLVVGGMADLGGRLLTAGAVNWISGAPPVDAFAAQVKTRYTAVERAATVMPLADGSSAQVTFDEPQRDITPGQAAVFLQNDLVLGGGLIQMRAQELA